MGLVVDIKMSFQDPTEEFVFKLCRKTFLSLWSYANPRRHGSTAELCDVLIVCEPDILIFSVKHCELNMEKPTEVALKRWWKKAVKASVQQIYGAERNLSMASCVTCSDGSEGLPLPPKSARRIHRISVSLGGRGFAPISSGDMDKGFVHVFDEESFLLVLRELDTVTDFCPYLTAKEQLAAERPDLIIEGGEKNLLAVYVHNDRKFPIEQLGEGVAGENWDVLTQKSTFARRVSADEISYLWDRLLEYMSESILQHRMEFGNTLSENEMVVRYMARESRFARRMLADSLREFWDLAAERKVRARMVPSYSGIVYVFFNPPAEYDREERIAELRFRCIIARNKYVDAETVIGFGYNVQPGPEGHAEDFILLSSPTWSEEQAKRAEAMQRDFGFFENPDYKQVHFDEYPTR